MAHSGLGVHERDLPARIGTISQIIGKDNAPFRKDFLSRLFILQISPESGHIAEIVFRQF